LFIWPGGIAATSPVALLPGLASSNQAASGDGFHDGPTVKAESRHAAMKPWKSHGKLISRKVDVQKIWAKINEQNVDEKWF